MDNFAPGLKEAVIGLANDLRIVVYFVCVTGLVIEAGRARAGFEELARPVVRATIIVGLVATLPYWFGFTENIFLSVANTIQEGYTDHPMRTAAKLRAATTGSATEFSLRRVGESVYQAFLSAAMNCVVLVASVLQVPLLILQYVLKLLCYLFLPVALALYMVPSQAQWATRYVQQTLAVLAWPVGFAVTELVAYHLLTAYANNLATAYNLTPGEIDAASFGSLLGGVVAALWLVLGTIATPFLMQGLICSGSPISGGAGAAVQQLHTLQQIASMLKSVKTAGVAAPITATSAAHNAGGGSPGLPPSPSVPPTPPPAAPAASDPAGDRRAATTLAASRLPAAQTSI